MRNPIRAVSSKRDLIDDWRSFTYRPENIFLSLFRCTSGISSRIISFCRQMKHSFHFQLKKIQNRYKNKISSVIPKFFVAIVEFITQPYSIPYKRYLITIHPQQFALSFKQNSTIDNLFFLTGNQRNYPNIVYNINSTSNNIYGKLLWNVLWMFPYKIFTFTSNSYKYNFYEVISRGETFGDSNFSTWSLLYGQLLGNLPPRFSVSAGFTWMGLFIWNKTHELAPKGKVNFLSTFKMKMGCRQANIGASILVSQECPIFWT